MSFKLPINLGLISILTLMLISCSSKDSATSPNNAVDTQAKQVATTRLYFDNIGQIPGQGMNKDYIIRLHNSYDKKFSVKSVKVIDSLTGKENKSLAGISYGLCEYVPANNSCNMTITPHLANSGSFILQAEVLNEAKGGVELVKQLIRVNNKIDSLNGILFDDTLSKVASPDGAYHIAFPVVLEANFDKLTARNGSVVCENGYQVGSNCTYFVDVNSSSNSLLIETKLEGYVDDKAVASRGVSVLAVRSGRANLLISIPADMEIGTSGESSITITLYNNGLQDATGIVITADKGAGVGTATITPEAGEQSNCTASLAPSGSCNFKVKVVSEINGYGSATANYKYDSTISTDNAIANFVFLNNAVDAELSVTTSGSLENLIVVVPESQTIIVTNNGERSITGISYNLGQAPSAMTISGSDTIDGVAGCGASGARTLKVSESCVLVVNYTPDTKTSTSTYDVYVSGRYITSDGNSSSIIAGTSPRYSAEEQYNVLTLSPDNFKFLIKKQTTEGKTLTVTNTSKYPVTLGSLSLSSTITGLSIDGNPPIGTKCNTDGVIAPTGGLDSCDIQITYSPTESMLESSSNVLVPIAKIANTNSSVVESAVVSVRATDTDPLPAQISVTIESQATGGTVTGDGGNSNPYVLIALPGNMLDLKYTFTAESGHGPALNFNISNSGLPYTAEIITATPSTSKACPTGISIESLSAGESCSVTVRMPRASLYNTNLLTSGTIYPLLSYTWQDIESDNGDTKFAKETTTDVRVNYTTTWLNSPNAYASVFVPNVAESTVKADITFTYSSVANNANVAFPLTVTPSLAGAKATGNCEILNSTFKSCTASVSLPDDIPAQDYKILVTVTDNSGTNQRKYTKTVTSTLSNAPIGNFIWVTDEWYTYAELGGFAKADEICESLVLTMSESMQAAVQNKTIKAVMNGNSPFVGNTAVDFYNTQNPPVPLGKPTSPDMWIPFNLPLVLANGNATFKNYSWGNQVALYGYSPGNSDVCDGWTTGSGNAINSSSNPSYISGVAESVNGVDDTAGRFIKPTETLPYYKSCYIAVRLVCASVNK